MDHRLYLINLYDYYGELLTDKQRIYFEEYYFENLTLSEISENHDISRNAIHKSLKETEENLMYYEKKLNLFDKKNKINLLIKDVDVKIKEKIEELI